jgi:hypothetical protein
VPVRRNLWDTLTNDNFWQGVNHFHDSSGFNASNTLLGVFGGLFGGGQQNPQFGTPQNPQFVPIPTPANPATQIPQQGISTTTLLLGLGLGGVALYALTR